MRRAVAIATVLGALVAPAAAHAAKPWGTTETVSRAPSTPVAAIGPDGRAVLGWSSNNTARGARRTPRRGFGEPFALYKQRSAVGFNTVSFDAAGNALFAFRRLVERNHRVVSATLRPSGARTSAISLSGPGSSAYDPTFAAPPAGTHAEQPTLAWWRRDRVLGPTRVQLATASRGRLLVAANDTLPDAVGARYAQRADGTVVAATTAGDRVVVAERPPQGSFSTPQTVTAGGRFRGVDVSVGPDGTVAVAWRQFVGSTYRMFLAVRPPGGTFGAAVPISGADERAVDPRVVVTSRGAVRAAYLATAPGNDRGRRFGRLRLVTLGAGRATVTAGSQLAREFDIAADGRGGVTLAWARREAGRFGGAVFARAVTPGGALGSRQVLTDRREDARGLDLAVGTRGDALVAWQTDDFRRLRAVRRPVTG